MRQGTTSPNVVQPVPPQEEPSTTPTAELEARAAHAMSTPQASLCRSPGDFSGTIADVRVSPLPSSQLILGGTTPRTMIAGAALNPAAPPDDGVELGVGLSAMEKEAALDHPDDCGAMPEQGQAQPARGPILEFSLEPIALALAASPNTISSTERMSTSPCLVIHLSQDLVDVEPVFLFFRMASSLDNPG